MFDLDRPLHPDYLPHPVNFFSFLRARESLTRTLLASVGSGWGAVPSSCSITAFCCGGLRIDRHASGLIVRRHSALDRFQPNGENRQVARALLQTAAGVYPPRLLALIDKASSSGTRQPLTFPQHPSAKPSTTPLMEDAAKGAIPGIRRRERGCPVGGGARWSAPVHGRQRDM
jgi:hypothetical protein